MLLTLLPTDILLALFCLCDVKVLLRLERTCHKLRELISTRQVWLAQLRLLDQAHAPNLPLHVDVRTLEYDELRTIVIKAIRGYENWRDGNISEENCVFVELTPPMPPSLGRQPCISQNDGILLVKLVPGGKYLFVHWSNGFVQIVDIMKNMAVWTYPDLSLVAESTVGKLSVWTYDVDFRSDGTAIFAAFRYDPEDREGTKKLIEVFHFKSEYQIAKKLYSRELAFFSPQKVDVAVQGDFLAILLLREHSGESILAISNFVTDQVAFAKVDAKYMYPMATIIREHLFLLGDYPDLPFYRVVDIRYLLTNMREDRRSASIPTARSIDELGFTSINLELPTGFTIEGSTALPSLCTFHWKDEPERFCQLTIEIPVEDEFTDSYGTFFNRYAFTFHESNNKPPSLNLISSTKVFPSTLNGERILSILYRPRDGNQCSLSDRSIMIQERDDEKEIVLTTIFGDDYAADNKPPASLYAAPKWLFQNKLGNGYQLDHLSGAVIFTRRGRSWVKIVYPA